MKQLKRIEVGEEPISLEEARAHLRLDVIGGTHPDDDLVEALITVAREDAEGHTSVTLIEQTCTLALDEFPVGGIDLETWPVNSIATVTYVDSAGDDQTVDAADYTLDTFSRPAKLVPVTTWPATGGAVNNVQIEFSAGYGVGSPPSEVPVKVKQALLLLIGHLYENRAAATEKELKTAPLAYMHLLQSARLRMGL